MMKTQFWNQTIMVWNDWEMQTNIRVTDWHKRKEIHFHVFQNLIIRSKFGLSPRRTAMAEFVIRRVSIGPTTKRNLIIKRLKQIKGIESISIDGSRGRFEYRLEPKESFCDSAIRIATSIRDALGFNDSDNFWLRDFLIFQLSFVLTKNGLITYDEYLRKRHHLKGPFLMRDRSLDIGSNISLVYRKKA